MIEQILIGYFIVPLFLYILHVIKTKRFKIDLISTIKTVFLWPIIILCLIWENI